MVYYRNIFVRKGPVWGVTHTMSWVPWWGRYGVVFTRRYINRV